MKKKLSLCSAAEPAPGDENPPKPRERRFNWRGFASLATGFAFLIMIVSGVVLYVAPRGRVANWTDWTVMGLGKEE